MSTDMERVLMREALIEAGEARCVNCKYISEVAIYNGDLVTGHLCLCFFEDNNPFGVENPKADVCDTWSDRSWF